MKLYTIIAFAKNKPGILYRVANLFLRRKINIESLTVSETEVKGISRFTIVVKGDTAYVQPGYIASLGLRIIPEDVTNRGRTDFTVFTDQDRVYIFEFKVNRDEAPLQQIKKMRYFEKYRGSDRKLMMVGIVFDTDERNILKMEWEEEK